MNTSSFNQFESSLHGKLCGSAMLVSGLSKLGRKMFISVWISGICVITSLWWS